MFFSLSHFVRAEEEEEEEEEEVEEEVPINPLSSFQFHSVIPSSVHSLVASAFLCFISIPFFGDVTTLLWSLFFVGKSHLQFAFVSSLFLLPAHAHFRNGFFGVLIQI